MSSGSKLFLRLFAASALLLFSVTVFVDGWPAWRALVFVLLVSGLIASGLFIGIGIGMNRAKALLERAVECAERGEFARARELVLFSVRMDPQLKERDEVKALYELIVANQRPANVAEEIRRLFDAMPSEREATRRFWGSPQFRVLVWVVLGLILLVRLANFGR